MDRPALAPNHPLVVRRRLHGVARLAGPVNRLAVARFGAYALVVGMFAGGLWLTEHRFDQSVAQLEAEGLARREASCEAGDETRQIIRQVTRDGDLEVGESIIEVADADAGIVAQFRDILGRRLTANVNQLPGRRWDAAAQECIDVELTPPTTEPGG